MLTRPLVRPLVEASGVMLVGKQGGALGLTFDEAFARNKTTLRDWFRLNTGPRVPFDPVPITGDVQIDAQADADALVGKMVSGRVFINVNDIELRDFGIQWDGSGTGTTLLQTVLGAGAAHIHHFLLDGLNGNISYGLSGTSYSEDMLVEYGEICRMGGDGIRTHKNSTYRYLYLHSFRPWVEAVDGVYDVNGSQSLFPHQDPIQGLRSGIVVEKCWIGGQSTINGTSGVIIKSDIVDETITSYIVRDSFVEGGGFPIYIDNLNNNIDDPGANGQPTGIVLENLLIGRDYRTAVYRHSEVPSSSITKTNILFADTRMAVPDLFVDGFNRANENVEASALIYERVSGVAGALAIDTNRVKSVSTTQSTYLLLASYPISLTDHYVQANWRGNTSATGWLIMRYVDENNYMGMQLNALFPTLYARTTAGGFVILGAAVAHVVGDAIRIEAEGLVARMYRNGTLVATGAIPAALASGRVGMQARSGTANPILDNFMAGTLPGYSG